MTSVKGFWQQIPRASLRRGLVAYLLLAGVCFAWSAGLAAWAGQNNFAFGPGAPQTGGASLPWLRWDTLHYLTIATQGYAADMQNTVWPPLYPLLIALFNLPLNNPLLAALLVSNLAALAALILFDWLISEQWGAETAQRAILWLCVYPGAFFLIAGYTESLFLVWVCGFFLALRRQRWGLAGILAAAATLTRNQGILLALPLAWAGWQWLRPQFNLRNAAPLGLSLALAPVSFGVFVLYIRLVVNGPWYWQTFASVWEQRFGWPWEGLLGNTQALIAAVQGYPVPVGTTLFDLLLSLLAIGLLIIGFRRLPVEYTLYAASMLLLNLSKVTAGSLLVSMVRYTLVLLPLFVVHVGLVRNKWLRLAWITFSAVSMLLLLSLFIFGYWVG